MTTPHTVVLEQTGEQHTVRKTFTVTGAPDWITEAVTPHAPGWWQA